MYGKVESTFWRDERIITLSSEARYLFLYLLTTPHRNMLGLYYLPAIYACYDMGWDENRLKNSLDELVGIQAVKYDSETSMVFIRNYLKYNTPSNPNQVKGIIAKLNEIPKTNLTYDFLEVVKQLEANGLEHLRAITLSKPFRNPFETVSKPVTVTVTVTETEAETITETEAETITGEGKGGICSSSDERNLQTDELFNEFWNEYPKKAAKKDALKVWQKMKPDEELANTIIEAVKQRSASTEWTKNNGEFIPLPASYLRGERWKDETVKKEEKRHPNDYFKVYL